VEILGVDAVPKEVSVVDSQAPEIRFRPDPEVYSRALRVAKMLGITVTDVARIGLAQVANSREIRLDERVTEQSMRDLPLYGTTVGRIEQIASAASRAAYEAHVRSGRLDPATDLGKSPER
jgi:antitoxin component of RelBE/YafQ-DinJ toxin-antitoxin module